MNTKIISITGIVLAALVVMPLLAAAQGTPTISSISPTSVVAGTNLTLTVNGSGFESGSMVNINGLARSTTFVSSSQLTTVLSPTDLATAGTYAITATNPGGGTSTSATLTVVSSAPGVPVIASVSPNTAVVQQDNTVITVMGSGFAPGAVINFNGAPLASTYVAPTEVLATVPASDMVLASTNFITANNPGTAVSNSMAFTVSAVPALPNTGFGPESPSVIQNLESLLVAVMASFAVLTTISAFKAWSNKIR